MKESHALAHTGLAGGGLTQAAWVQLSLRCPFLELSDPRAAYSLSAAAVKLKSQRSPLPSPDPRQLRGTLPLTRSSKGSAGSGLPSGQLPIVSIFSFSSQNTAGAENLLTGSLFGPQQFPTRLDG